MHEDLCQLVIDRNVPLLVELLLESPIDGKEGYVKVDPAVLERCLLFAKNHLESPDQEEFSAEAAWITMNHFLERYHSENQSDFAETFQQLANVVLSHPICVNHPLPDLQWRLIDFLLSVAHGAFQTTRRHYRIMDQKRKNILEALTLAESSEVAKEELKRSDDKTGELSKEENQLSADEKISKEKSQSSRTLVNSDQMGTISNAEGVKVNPPISEPEPLASSETWEPSNLIFGKQLAYNNLVRDRFASKDAEMELELNLTQVKSTAEKPTTVNRYKESNNLLTRIQTPWWQVEVHVYNKPRILASNFSQSYGDYLINQLRKNRHSVKKMSEEHQLLNELIILFFANVNSHDFKILDDKMELRSDEPRPCALKHLLEEPHLAEIISYIKQMRHLREFIETHAIKRGCDDRLETLTFFSVALRRLLRPVMEFMVFFERRLARGLETPTLQNFAVTSRGLLENIKWLCELSKETREEQPSLKGLKVLETLFTHCSRNIHPKIQRALSASLLLHSLQAYCGFLDSWWSTGDFADWHEEFPYQRIEIERRTEYELRKLWVQNERIQNGDLFHIIRRHISKSSEAIAILYDTQKMGNFNSFHKINPETSLHNSLMTAVLRELAHYQTERVEEIFYAPDILDQLRSTDDDAVRRLFYSLYMETRPDPRIPAAHSIQELLRNFRACAHYTPLKDIISQQLKRLLNRRSLMANSYVSEMVYDFKMGKMVKHLRNVFLLSNYDFLRNEFELFFEYLEGNQMIDASNKLRDIVRSQDPKLGYLLYVSLTKQHPELMSIMVFDPLLNRVISQKQIKQMNNSFSLMTNMHFSLYQLNKLPSLDNSKVQRLVKTLESLKDSLVSVLEEQLSRVDKVKQILQELYSFKLGLNEFMFLNELKKNQERFILRKKQLLSDEFEGGKCSSEEVISLSRVLRYRWLRVRALLNEYRRQKPKNIFDMKYERMRYNYLHFTLKKIQALKSVYFIN
ncbi:hypothetical protein KR084_008648 [Drosophila pseudotakahashii]|nr:hypothetical protein KR084_008648 [Drosophila pseudotakahashii]